MVKKAYIRTLEAVISAIIIFLVIYGFMPKAKIEVRVPENIRLTQEAILNEIQTNAEWREKVNSISNNFVSLNESISKTVPGNLLQKLMICDSGGGNCNCDSKIDNGCTIGDLNLPEKTVYSKSVFVATPREKIFRLYLWQK